MNRDCIFPFICHPSTDKTYIIWKKITTVVTWQEESTYMVMSISCTGKSHMSDAIIKIDRTVYAWPKHFTVCKIYIKFKKKNIGLETTWCSC